MAHRLRNGDYKHKGVTIGWNKLPCSTGWMIDWTIAGVKYDTLALAIKAIERQIGKPVLTVN